MTIRVIKIRSKGAVALRRLRLSDVIKMAVLPVSPLEVATAGAVCAGELGVL